jgi:hypothetical protein
MWSGLIEIDQICLEKTMELLLMENQEMIQAFSPHATRDARSQTAFARGVRYGVRRILIPLVVAIRAKFGPNLRSLSRIKYRGLSPYGVASRNCCATQASVGVRVTFTWITFRDFNEGVEEGKKRTEEEIRDLQEITSPHLCSMIAKKRLPVLSTGSLWANLTHILLDGPFTDPNIQLEQLATNALRPEDAGCLLPSP